MNIENEIVLFETSDKEIRLNVKVDHDTVWLNRNQMSELFGRDVKTIGKHINNALREEMDNSTVANFATVQKEGERLVERSIEYYDLEMIISVSYRVKSKRGIEFRRWANKVLKEYIIKGYAINEKRLQALQKTVEIQTKMLANTMDIEQDEVLKAVNLYTQALQLLDQYDHQTLAKPEGNQPTYRISHIWMKLCMKTNFRSCLMMFQRHARRLIASVISFAIIQRFTAGPTHLRVMRILKPSV